MQLTGKAKEDFEHWFSTTENHDISWMINKKICFHDLLESMQFGVYVDFFESKEIYINTCYMDDLFKNSFLLEIANKEGHTLYEKEVKTRSEARAKAIEESNKLY